jgi:tetratricopeptide (TPR) repeat protein
MKTCLAVCLLLAANIYAFDIDKTRIEAELKKIPGNSDKEKAGILTEKKMKMARLAIDDKDEPLAERLLREAFYIYPDSANVAYELALFLSTQGQGKEALKILDDFPAQPLDSAPWDYLKLKIQNSAILNGKYLETRKQYIDPKGTVRNLAADGTITMDYGLLVWEQRINGRPTVQTYSYQPMKMATGRNEFDLELTWRTITTQDKTYIADRYKVVLYCRKLEQGWTLYLHMIDESGNVSNIDLKLDTKSKRE